MSVGVADSPAAPLAGDGEAAAAGGTGPCVVSATLSNVPAAVVEATWLVTARPTLTEGFIGIVTESTSVHAAPSVD